MQLSMKFLLFLLWYLISEASSEDIFANIGEDVTFLSILKPLPKPTDIVVVVNQNNERLFSARGVLYFPNSLFNESVEFNGNTTAGEMNFTLKSISRDDSGIYRYVYGVDDFIYVGQILYVFGKPNQPLIEKISAPIVNTTFVLKCTAESETVPTIHNLSMLITWNINGRNISATTSRFSINGSQLSVQNIQKNDRGIKIECQAKEYGGLTSNYSDSYTVYPEYGPETVVLNPEKILYSITENGSIPDIICHADCFPNCSYTWKKDDKVTSYGIGSILSLRNIIHSDAGIYRCEAWNEHGTGNSSDITVDVLYGPKTVNVTPDIVNYLTNESGTIKDISCSAYCKPSCNYTWTEDGQVTSYGFGNTLSLRNVTRYDTGVYRCTAWNGHGKKNSSDIIIDVMYGPETVIFTPSNSKYSTTEFGTVNSIVCSADCKPNCSFIWTKYGQAISHGSYETLNLKNITRNDTGEYRCKAMNNYGEKFSSTININVLFGPDPIKFTPSNDTYTINEGHFFPNITCRTSCNPVCNFTWRRPDGSTLVGEKLIIGTSNRHDSGIYSCIAQNEISKKSKELDAIIQYGPGTSIQLEPAKATYTFIENTTTNISVSCHADCIPKCTYKWSTTGINTPLVFGKVDRSQAGTYVCITSNGAYSANITIKLIIQYPSRIIDISSNKKIAMEKDKVILNCTFDAVPPPKVVWSKDNGTILDVRKNLLISSLFTIENANCVDTGNYTCTVDNKITDNSQDSKSHRISVNCAPRLKSPQLKPEPVTVTKSHGLNISTSFIAYPLPNITWTFKNKSIDRNQSVQLEKTEVIELFSLLSKNSISENDFGIYKVVAENAFGEANALFDVQAKELEGLTSSPSIPLIGAATGSVLVLIVVTTIILIILFVRRRQNKHQESNDGLRLRSADSDEDEMKDNILYEPAGPNYVKPDSSLAKGKMKENSHSSVERAGGLITGNRNSADIYAKVQKKEKQENRITVNPRTIHSQVRKPKKREQGEIKLKKQLEKQKQKPDMVYENFDMKAAKGSSLHPFDVEQKQNVKPGKRDKNGLQYADLVFAPPGSGKVFVIHGSENRTNYVDIDFTKRAEPLPLEHSDGNDDKTAEI